MNSNFIQKIPKLLLVVAGFALVQQLRLLEVDGINPNLVLSALAAVAFAELPFWAYLGLAFVGGLLLQLRVGISIEFLAIMGLAPLFWLLRKISPWRAGLGNLIFTSIGTVLFYAIVDYAFIVKGAEILVKEIVYNLIIVGALYSLFNYLYETEE